MRRSSTTGPAWLFALALLLRAAMPFLADLSAEAQGRALGEVCTVYGVVVDAKHRDAPGAAHGGDDCALHALAALGTAGGEPRLCLPPLRAGHEEPSRLILSPRFDATAAWLARRKQGPPGLA